MEIVTMIDHTLLKPDATKRQIEQLCQEAKAYKFAAVCVNPTWVEVCHRYLQNEEIAIATVVGFPLGATTTAVKAYEAEEAVHNGATEIDMVLNIGALKSGNCEFVKRDIAQVVEQVRDKAIVKVILETHLLTKEEMKQACELAKQAGAHFVKTSTGFLGGGATAEDVALMKEVVGAELGVKASGGIRTKEAALQMIEAGATRIGTSAGITIANG